MTEKRDRAIIEPPYLDLDDAVAIARAIYTGSGMSPCTVEGLMATLERLAAQGNNDASSGDLQLRISSAQAFGFLENRDGELRLTKLGYACSHLPSEGWVRHSAFCQVPLYRTIYERYKGTALPPPVVLERTMIEFGVPAKRVSDAREAFMRSAYQAERLALADQSDQSFGPFDIP